jgi:hypothetical protein
MLADAAKRSLLPAVLTVLGEALAAGCSQSAVPPGLTDAGSDAGSGGAVETTQKPYANVAAVTTMGAAQSYTFVVTIESADIDCTQYADFWEVLSPDGALLYRRVLDHSHTDANGQTDPDAPGNTFTRDGGPVAIGATEAVIVRAHMNNAGYNGRVLRGSASTGFAVAPDIGPDFATGVQALPPQPNPCQF